MSHSVSVVVEHDEHGYYAYCPSLAGCQSQGDTMEEVMENIREAIGLYVETFTPEELIECVSKEVMTTSVVVGGV